MIEMERQASQCPPQPSHCFSAFFAEISLLKAAHAATPLFRGEVPASYVHRGISSVRNAEHRLQAGRAQVVGLILLPSHPAHAPPALHPQPFAILPLRKSKTPRLRASLHILPDELGLKPVTSHSASLDNPAPGSTNVSQRNATVPSIIADVSWQKVFPCDRRTAASSLSVW